jgi:hypothetical protein
MTPAERVRFAIQALEIVVHAQPGVAPHDDGEVVRVDYFHTRGTIVDTFGLFNGSSGLLPRFERKTLSTQKDIRGLHILEDDHATTSLLRNGTGITGGEAEITKLAEGIEGIMGRIMMPRTNSEWWIKVNTKTE